MSLKLLGKCSISVISIKGIIYFIVAFSLKRDWNHKEPEREGQGSTLRSLGCFKSCFIVCLKALCHPSSYPVNRRTASPEKQH